MVKYAPAVGALVLAVVCGIAGFGTRELACDRQACTYGEARFAVADVRDVQFVDGLGKNGGRAESVLVFASGHELRLGRADTDAARETFQDLRAFFGGTAATLTIREPRPWAMLVVAIGLLVAAAVLAMRPPTLGWPRIDWRPRKHTVTGLAIVIAGGMVVVLVVNYLASRNQGTLELVCRQRCRFQGGECLPGGELSTTLDPGTYTVDVWARTGSALWIPKAFESGSARRRASSAISRGGRPAR